MGGWVSFLGGKATQALFFAGRTDLVLICVVPFDGWNVAGEREREGGETCAVMSPMQKLQTRPRRTTTRKERGNFVWWGWTEKEEEEEATHHIERIRHDPVFGFWSKRAKQAGVSGHLKLKKKAVRSSSPLTTPLALSDPAIPLAHMPGHEARSPEIMDCHTSSFL